MSKNIFGPPILPYKDTLLLFQELYSVSNDERQDYFLINTDPNIKLFNDKMTKLKIENINKYKILNPPFINNDGKIILYLPLHKNILYILN
jgi:hypothetical protein